MIIDLSNPSLVRFINLLKQRYDFANISSYFHPEADFFAELEKALAHEITRTGPSIRCHLLSSLQARVRTILRGLTRH
jgi:glutamate/tyrosine decarboxylase-like PLP-dependent enzyme